jgi:two-component system NtrC family sensor kinase
MLSHTPAAHASRPFIGVAMMPRSSPLQGARVLVVDDEPGIAELLTDLLEAAGCSVVTAGSGQQALALLSTHNIDLVVSDLRMPDIDGAGLWRELRDTQPALIRRMMFVTGDTLSPAAHAFLATSGCPSLDKPFSRNDLLRGLTELLAR